jgi:glycosyltransferase involved in cell wall biosynthesis
MKIILDPQIFNMQTYGGISRYYTEIFRRLNKRKNISIILPIHSTNNVYVANSGLLLTEKKLITPLIKTLNIIGISTRSLNKRISEKQIKNIFENANFDLFIPTYYDPCFLEIIDNKPFVLTVYDMIHELFPQYFIDDYWNVKHNKKVLIEKATKIIAVSNNTKKDIIKIYPHIDESKIEVIYHGNSIQVNENITIDLPENYILFVGSRDNYKNFYFLVEAIKDLLISDPTLILISAGGGKFKDEEIKFINDLGIQNQIEQRYFEENELGIFYKNAKCFVFPSQYEGFGLPVIESMACGCPIVLSNASSFPEVAGDAGIFFENNNKEDLRNKIELVLNDVNFRDIYIQKGLERSRLFTWEIAAEKCLEFYKTVINN